MRRLMPAAAALVALVGCGEGEDTYQPPPPPAPRAERAPAAAPSVEERVAEMMQSLDRATFTNETRDPFMPLTPTSETRRATTDARPDCNLQEEPLGQTRLEQIVLLGIITGTAMPRALVQAGAGTRQAVIMTEGMLAGPNCTQRLVDIRENEIVFREVTFDDTSFTETILQLSDIRLAAQVDDPGAAADLQAEPQQ
ncbi:MAG: pilus assembly protein PilP [Myxococcales bacterium]|nr:pilus assembly protein PilP [Myxococcales bacterium]MCB9519322.1 pilus assembly protein PilP [Myxococcales bacterium]MCB9530766.1 pilus assembly protein PilP [Myxococcales bacterium]MCB9533340.1 pilus assembly protein PilP [Myxococcales bacterium]